MFTIGCCCCTGPGKAPAWPAAVTPPGAGTPNGAVADGSMACHAHITPTREDTSNEVIGPPTGFLFLLLYRSRDTSGLASNGPRRGRHYPWCRSRWKHALPLAHDTHVGGHEQRHSTYTAYTGISLHGLGHEPEALHSTAAGIHSWQQQRKHTHSRHATRRLHRGMLQLCPWFYCSTRTTAVLLLVCIHTYIHTYIHTHRRYFQHAHFIPIVGVGKRGEY